MSRRCSYCWERGHNKRTCPSRPQRQIDFDKQWMKKPGRKAGTQTQCSYCGLYGHNRRTCVHLKRKKAQALSCVEGSVRRALSAFQEYGLGVGAMFTQTSSWRQNETATYLVTGDKLEASVSYREDRYRVNCAYSSHAWSRHHAPAFRVHINAMKMCGHENRPIRTESSQVRVYNDLREKQQITNSEHLRHFEECNNKWLGKSHAPFSHALVERLQERARYEVEEYYRDKDNQHPDFSDEHFILAEQAHFEQFGH